MKNKGFTLIELLAVIAVISFVLLIAFSFSRSIIDNTKENLFVKNNQTLIKAATEYFSINPNLLPKTEGETVEVSLNTLKENNYIGNIKDPNDGSLCSGYITVTKVAEKYYYIPNLRCDSTVNNSTEDNMVINYTFDDFQEPTVNLISYNGSFEASSGKHIGLIANSNGTGTNMNGGWRCSTHYNNGICSIENGGLFGEKFVRWYHYETNGWRAATSGGFSVEATRPYTVSVYTRVNRGDYGSPSAYGFYGPAGYRYYVSWEKSPAANPGQWIRGVHTFTPDINTSGTVYLYGLSGSANGLIVDYDGYQAEQKPYATPFTVGSRSGIVKNYSAVQNNSTLQLTTTPRWINKTYLFDGVNDLIQSDNALTINTSQTYMAWIYPSNLTGLKGIVSMHNHSQTSNFGLNQMDSRISVSIGYTDSTREYMAKLSSGLLIQNKWNHVALVYNSALNRVYLYLNGKLDSTHIVSKTPKFTNERLIVGQWSTSYLGNYVFNGNIDEVKVFRKPLSENDIKEIYISSLK